MHAMLVWARRTANSGIGRKQAGHICMIWLKMSPKQAFIFKVRDWPDKMPRCAKSEQSNVFVPPNWTNASQAMRLTEP
jgi:hypothetical protein